MKTLALRRWETFKSNRRALAGLWFFGIFFLLSMGAELIANDRPILVKYMGHYYVPAIQNLTE